MALQQIQKQKQVQRYELRQMMLTNLLGTTLEELDEKIAQELAENPALEISENTDSENFTDGKDTSSEGMEAREISLDEVQTRSENSCDEKNYDDNTDDWEADDYNRFQYSKDEEFYEKPIVSQVSFREKLLKQIGELIIDERDRLIAETIVGFLEDNGYLTAEPISVASNLFLQGYQDVTPADVERVLTTVIHTLEPAGIGARNLQECLLLQLQSPDLDGTAQDVALARKVIQTHFNSFIQRQFAIIQRKEKVSEEQLTRAIALIKKLTPSPGEGSENVVYITPDFEISIENGELHLSLLNERRPALRVNREYEQMLQKMREKRNQEAIKFIRENIDRAKLFIESLPERDRTMYLVMNEIMNQQREYFLTGDRKMLKPMVLRSIAQKTGLDESTISRVTSKHYANTPFGTILLKDLFSEAANDVDGISANAIRQRLLEIIEKEDKKHPYTDEKLAELLKADGYDIARRTAAKYREQLNIPATSVRRQR